MGGRRARRRVVGARRPRRDGGGGWSGGGRGVVGARSLETSWWWTHGLPPNRKRVFMAGMRRRDASALTPPSALRGATCRSPPVVAPPMNPREKSTDPRLSDPRWRASGSRARRGSERCSSPPRGGQPWSLPPDARYLLDDTMEAERGHPTPVPSRPSERGDGARLTRRRGGGGTR